MATLNENVAKVKSIFSDIKGCVNAKCEEYTGEADHIKSETKPEDYGGEIYGAFDDVHEAGKQSVISNSKYIPKTATGKVISLTDVSEVAHKVKVYGDNQEVDVYGTNFIDYTKAEGRNTTAIVSIVDDGVEFTGDYYFRIPVRLARNTAYTLSFSGGTPTAKWCYAYEGNINLGSIANTGESRTTKAGEDVKYIYIYPFGTNGESGTTTVINIMLDLGTTATAYEPPSHQTITATPSGTEIDSICPNMTIIADTDITVDYYSSFGMAESQNRFANSHQQNGARMTYTYAYAYNSWNDYTFEQAVNYDIVPNACNNMFDHSLIKDLAGIMKRKGIVFDFITNAPNQAFNVFASSTIEHIPKIIMPTTSSAYGWYTSCTQLHTIDGMVCNEKTLFQSNSGTNMTFQNCHALTHCIFSGVIAKDINLQWCKLLDEESLISLVDCLVPLEDHSSRTITLSPESWAILESVKHPADALGDGTWTYKDHITDSLMWSIA